MCFEEGRMRCGSGNSKSRRMFPLWKARADGVVRSSSDYPFAELTSAPAPLKEASLHFVKAPTLISSLEEITRIPTILRVGCWKGVCALVLLAAMLVLLGCRNPIEPSRTDRLTDDPALGPKNAPVTIVEYGDFGCTACRAWHNADVLEDLRSKYGDKIRFVFRDFPVITPESPKAAEAGQCAYDQGKFWEYHDRLYTAPAIDVPHLKESAAETGLDMASFNQCLDSGRHAATVNQDLQDATKRGFPGTPAFLLNDRPLEGPPTLENFQTTIDRVLGGTR
jgi:protein-disulfide isomerase